MGLDLKGFVPLIEVFDMATSLAFYRDMLGFEVIAQYGPGDTFDWCMLKHGEMFVMLNSAYESDERPAAPDPARVAAHEDTKFYFDCADPDAAYTQLRAKGFDASAPTVTHYGMKQVYVLDPDGYSLCFQARAAEP